MAKIQVVVNIETEGEPNSPELQTAVAEGIEEALEYTRNNRGFQHAKADTVRIDVLEVYVWQGS